MPPWRQSRTSSWLENRGASALLVARSCGFDPEEIYGVARGNSRAIYGVLENQVRSFNGGGERRSERYLALLSPGRRRGVFGRWSSASAPRGGLGSAAELLI
jgi:hypothetical protein